jgi:hypothetical protein
MGAYLCPACNGQEIADNAGGMKCLACKTLLEFAPGPVLVVAGPADPDELRQPEVIPEPEPEPEPAVEDSAADEDVL